MRKLNKLIRNENGSITMFVTLSVLFLIFVLVGIYANYANKLKAQEDRIGKIQKNYGQYASDEAMDKLYIKQTQTEEDNEGDAGEENVPLLPAEYQQVEYIESTGTQYIDTGVIFKENTEIITQYALTANEKTYIWGNSNGGSRLQFRYGGVNEVFFGYGGNASTGYTTIDISDNPAQLNKKYTIKCDKGCFYIDNELITTISSTTEENDNNGLVLFALRTANKISNYSKVKIYSHVVYQNGKIVQNLIPCYQKSDNVAGMYDTVKGAFYKNLGTGDFEKGEDVNKKVEDDVGVELPTEYQQVEYIESTGTQYIDTGVVCNENLKIEVKYKISSFEEDMSYIFGVYGESGSYRVQYSHANVIFAGFGNMYSDNITAPKEDKKYNLIMDNGKFTLDGEVIYDATSAGGKYSSTNNATITLFARNGNGSIGNYSSNRIYSCKMSIGETEVRNLVPCYRKSDSVAGMYDLTNKVFYTNSGTGSFLKGPYADRTTEVAYIQSTGTQYIDTGIKLNQDSKIELEFEVTEAGDYNIFGSRSSATSNNIGIIFSNTYSQINVDFQDYTKNRLTTTNDISKKIYTISNTTLRAGDSSTLVTNYSNFTTPDNAYIFSMSGTPPAYENAKMKLYYCKIWNGETLVRDYIPVLDKDGVACLYDKVEGKYYYNQGTGTFSYE